MNDREHDELLEKFINSTSPCKGGNVKVTVSPHSTHFEPCNGAVGFKYEDAIYIDHALLGARQFLYFLERNGYEITRGKSKNDKKRKDKKTSRR